MNKTWKELNAMVANAQKQLETLYMQKEHQIKRLHWEHCQWCRGRTIERINKINANIADIHDKLNGKGEEQ